MNTSDLETLKQMFRRAKIEFSEHLAGGLRNGKVETNPTLSIERGYIGFVTEFTFDSEGTLLDVGAYE